MSEHKIYSMPVSTVYPHYVVKAEKKGRTKADVDELITWLCGYDAQQIDDIINSEMTFREFFERAPKMNPDVKYITGKVCGVTVEDIEDPLMKNIRYLDKIIDELSRGWSMDKIKRIEKRD